LEYRKWSTEILEYWSDGVVEEEIGVVEQRSNGVMGN
jgi:hypothetical protein